MVSGNKEWAKFLLDETFPPNYDFYPAFPTRNTMRLHALGRSPGGS